MLGLELASETVKSFADAVAKNARSVDGTLVLKRSDFDPLLYAAWLPDICVGVADGTGAFVYKIYGENLASVNGRNLIGRSTAEWPDLVSRELLAQTAWTRRHRRPAICRFTGQRFSPSVPGQLDASRVTYEKLMFPMIWADREIDGFLSMTQPLTSDEMAAFRSRADAACQCIPERPACSCALLVR